MTLIEVLVALAMFSIVFGGIFGMARLMYKTSMSNVAEGVALHAAEGILEQMRAMTYDNTFSKSGCTFDSSGSRVGDPNIGLRQLCTVTAADNTGAYYVPISYFSTDDDRNYNTAAQTDYKPVLRTQYIQSNLPGFMPLYGVAVNGEYDAKKNTFKQVPLNMRVRVLVNEKATDTNFGAGITIEVYYRYRLLDTTSKDKLGQDSDRDVQRVLRTFIARGVS